MDFWGVKSGWATQSKSLNVFEERYHFQQSIVLIALNVKTHGLWLYMPIYADGRIGSLNV